jgi:formylmethanofuran dehydrogenase subunit E
MFKQRLVMVIALLAIAATACSRTTNPWPEFYDQSPVIQIIDPMAVLVGSMPEGSNMLTIKLADVALYSGHICPSMASGYMLTKIALDTLYPGSTPERGQIRVAAMAASDLVDVASYITGARAFYGRDEINAGDLVIDPALNPKQGGKYVMVFQRKDTGKAVKAVFDKFKLIPPEQVKEVKVFLEKMLAGKALPQEKEEKWAQLQGLVKKVLLETPEGVVEITPIDEYQFPEFPKKQYK